MAQISFQIQAATDAALTALMLQHGLMLLGEGAPSLAPGVLYSHIGDAALENGDVKLAGRYAFVSVDDSIFGVQAAASLLLALDAHLYKGPALRYLLGGINWHESGAVPQAVTMRQARLALLGAGKLAQVEAAINALQEPQKSAAKITWEYSQEVQRHNGLVPQMAAALGMTDAQIDALFVAASKL